MQLIVGPVGPRGQNFRGSGKWCLCVRPINDRQTFLLFGAVKNQISVGPGNLLRPLSEGSLIIVRDRLKMWVFSNEVSFIWLRPPTHPLQMKVWKTEYRCTRIINQTPPKNIGFRTMYSPYACHDKGSIYESLSFQNHRHLISSKCTYNSTSILYQ